jgi:hypothetical protein
MDPNAPQPQQRYSMSLTNVQRWVASVLAVSTIFHLAIGLVLAGWLIHGDRAAAAGGLLAIAAICGVLAMATGLLIHQRAVLSWWLLPGLIPALVGAYLFFG